MKRIVKKCKKYR